MIYCSTFAPLHLDNTVANTVDWSERPKGGNVLGSPYSKDASLRVSIALKDVTAFPVNASEVLHIEIVVEFLAMFPLPFYFGTLYSNSIRIKFTGTVIAPKTR